MPVVQGVRGVKPQNHHVVPLSAVKEAAISEFGRTPLIRASIRFDIFQFQVYLVLLRCRCRVKGHRWVTFSTIPGTVAPDNISMCRRCLAFSEGVRA